MKNPVGRPKTENALTRDGRMFSFWMGKNIMEWLDVQSRKTGRAKAEIVRNLIKDAMKN
jgi:predicted DNA-binding protein